MRIVKLALETILISLLYFTGIYWLYEKLKPLGGRKIPIIFYHEIGNDRSRDLAEFSVSVGNFEKQMRWLSKHYTVVPIDELIAYIDGTKKTHKRIAAISFDGGYIGNYLYAYHILKKYNLPATIYVITDAVDGKLSRERILLYLLSLSSKDHLTLSINGTNHIFQIGDFIQRVASKKKIEGYLAQLGADEQDRFVDRIAEDLNIDLSGIARSLFLSWDQIQEINKDSLIDIGSHTLTHPRLTDIPAEQARREIGKSKRKIEDKLGKAVNSFCYPDGFFSEEVIKFVKEAGYTSALAVSTQEVFSDLNKVGDDVYRLRRICMPNLAYSPLIACEVLGLMRVLKK